MKQVAEDLRTVIRLYARLPQTRVLGPFLRYALWVQGCRRSCPGCMTPDARPFHGGESMGVERLADEISGTPGIEGITVSGGEPLLQAGPLSVLIRSIRKEKDLGVILYTGYTLEELRGEGIEGDRSAAAQLLEEVDLLIGGPYVESMDDGRSLRGSANQGVHRLSRRYADLADRFYGRPGRAVELHCQPGGLFLAGIPGPDALKKWRQKVLLKRPTP